MKTKLHWHKPNVIVIATLLAGVLLTVGGTWKLSDSNRNHIVSAVAETSQLLTGSIIERITLYQYGLRGARGTILTAGENGITRQKFAAYSKTRDVDDEFPGARGFGFIRRVLPEDEAVFVEQARKDGAPGFAVRQLNPHTEERYIIQYIEPVERNAEAVGLDIGSETNRRTAAYEAMVTGRVQLTGPITLVQASGNPQQSFLILMPIYRPGMPVLTPQQRIAATFGWSYAPLLMEEVLADLHLNDDLFSVTLADVTDPENPARFFANMDEASTYESEYETIGNISIFGRNWLVNLTPRAKFIDNLNRFPPQIVLISGTVGSIALAFLVAVVSMSQRNRREIAKQRSELASIVESSFDAVIGQDLNGVITSWNPGATRLFGYSQEDAIGRIFADFLVPDFLRNEEITIKERLEQGDDVENFETQRLHRDGRMIEVFVTISPILSPTGKVIGSSKTMRDFTIQKEARKRISEMNLHLEKEIALRTTELTNVNSLLLSLLHAATEISIIATDKNGVIRVFNSGAENLLRCRENDVVGFVSLQAFFKDAELKKYAKEMPDIACAGVQTGDVLFFEPRNGATTIRDWTQVRADGSEFTASTVISEIRDDNGVRSGFLCVSTDVTEQRNFGRQLEAARDQLQMAADVAEMGVWSWEIGDNSLIWNDQMYSIYGYPVSLKEAGIGYEHWRSKVHPDEVGELTDRLQAVIGGTDDFDVVFRIIPSPGDTRFIQAGANVERDVNGNAIRITGFNRDITDQKHREDLLHQARENADKASVAKSNFLANMSHEIRTPMNAILGMLQLTQQTELSDRQRDFLGKAHGAAKALLGLLNDILDYSKIEADKLEIDIHEFDLIELFHDLGAILYGSNQSKDVDIVFDIDPGISPLLKGDSLRLRQILINLAGNALKFTKHGFVRVSVSQVGPKDSESCMLRFCVEDTGIGISRDQLARLFTGFTQAETSTSREFGGTGLGLVICDRLVSLLGGQITVESVLGQGSKFVFELKFDVPSDGGVDVGTVPAPRPDVSVMLFASQAHSSAVYADLISKMGYEVFVISSVAEFENEMTKPVETGAVRTVVIDEFRLPDDDVLKLQMAIDQGAEHGLGVISLVRDDSKFDLQKFSGLYKYLHKPFSYKQLGQVLAEYAGTDSDETSSALVMPEPMKRLQGMKLLVVEDNEINRFVASELLGSEGALVDLANSGAEGVQKALDIDKTYDVVIMDVQMPVMDGLEATRIIRKFKKQADLPIIAMTGNASLSDRADCLGVGMNDHISKPIDLEHVVRILTGFYKESGNQPI